MSKTSQHLALFREIDLAAEALDRLRELGVKDEEMTIISGVPYSDLMLGRPMSWTLVPKIAIMGFILGMLVGLAFNLLTPLQYPIVVGGMPIVAIPPSLILTFEFSMLGLLGFTFLGVIWESAFPSFGPKEYHESVSDGEIAVVFSCYPEIFVQADQVLMAMGAEWTDRSEDLSP